MSQSKQLEWSVYVTCLQSTGERYFLDSMIFVLLGYMWLFVHRPFEVWPWMGDMHIERIYMFFALFFWFFLHEKTFLKNRVVIALIAVVSAILFSSYMTEYGEFFDRTVEDWCKVVIFSFLLITSVHDEKDFKILIIGFNIIFFIYTLHSYFEFKFHDRHVYRMGTVRMIGIDESMADPNSFGGSVVLALTMILPLWKLQGDLKIPVRLFAIANFLLCTLCIISTGSRGSFVALLLFLLMAAIFSKYRVRILILLVILAPIVWASMTDNLRNRYLTIIDSSKGPESAQNSALGRIEGFKMGMRLWKKHPVHGVGPGLAGKVSGVGFQTHNFVGQVCGELGTVGALAYLLLIFFILLNFYTSIGYNTIYSYYVPDNDGFYFAVSTSVFFSLVLLLLLGYGSHNALRYTWVWYAVFQGIAVEIMQKKIEQQVLLRR